MDKRKPTGDGRTTCTEFRHNGLERSVLLSPSFDGIHKVPYAMTDDVRTEQNIDRDIWHRIRDHDIKV